MQLLILTTKEKLLEKEVTRVNLPGSVGPFEVLKRHCSLTSLLTTGHIIYYDVEGRHDISVTKGGVVAVADDEVKVLLH